MCSFSCFLLLPTSVFPPSAAQQGRKRKLIFRKLTFFGLIFFSRWREEFSVFSIWHFIQGRCPCLGTDKTCTSNTYQALLLHQRNLQSTLMLLQEQNYAMFLFIIEWRDGVQERGEEEPGSDKCCFAGLVPHYLSTSVPHWPTLK